MRKYAFILTVLGFFLLTIFFNSSPISISSPDSLSNFEPNQKFLIQGTVIKETLSQNQKTLHLDNNFKISTDKNTPSLLNKNISAIIILETYNNNNYLKSLRIKIQDP